MNKLLRVVHPEARESCMGFALRLANHNHLSSPWHMFRVAGMSQSNMSVLHFNSEKMRKLTGLPMEVLDEIACSASTFLSAQVMFRGHSISRKLVRNQIPRVCPHCIAENPVALAAWDLQSVLACPKHRVMLVEHCHACTRRLSWIRPSVTTCRCGADLRTTPTLPAADGVVFTSAAVETSLFRSPGAWRAAELPPKGLLDAFAQTPLQEMVGALSEMARLLLVAPRDFPTCELAQHYEAVGTALRAWPGALHAAFESFAEDRLSVTRASARHYGELDLTDVMVIELDRYKRWSRRASETIRNFLSEEMARCIGSRSTLYAIAPRNVRRSGIPADQGWVTVIAAAAILKMDPRTFHKLLASGSLETKTEESGTTTRILVKTDSLTPNLIRDQMIGRPELGMITGWPVGTLSNLKKSGTLPAQYKGPGLGFMAMQDLKALTQQWCQIRVAKRPLGVATTDICSAFRGPSKCHSIEWKSELIRRLMRGDVKTFDVSTAPTFNATVETSVVLALQDEFAVGRSGIGRVSKALVVSPMGVIQLAVAGKLSPTFEDDRVFFSMSDVEAFKNNYVRLSRLLHSLKQGERFAAQCRENGVETVRVMSPHGPVDYAPKEAAMKLAARLYGSVTAARGG